MACPPSARLEDQYEDSTSVFAEEGTFAHELSELHLGLFLDHFSKMAFTRRLNKKKQEDFYSQDMEDYVQQYVDIVIERINEARARSEDAEILIEQRLDFSEWVPEGFGTGDVVIISDGKLEVIDLKYGKGVEVSAVENPQLRLYGLGAYNQFGMLYDLEEISTTIVQPRLDNISTETLSVSDLVAWAETEVKPKADLADKGEGYFTAGDHCRFCKARFTCRARADANLELAKHDFAKPDELEHDEISGILEKAKELQKWAADIEKYALEQAEQHGTKFPGWKLVEGRSNRKYTDETAVFETLTTEGYEEDRIAPRKLLTLSNLEKTIGKKQFGDLLGDLVIKPAGKPTLVPESDKRPELNSTDSAAADFEEQ